MMSVTMKKPKNVRQLVVEYWGSDAFRKLGSASQRDYYDCLTIIKDDEKLGSISLKRLSVPIMQRCYNVWLGRGIPRANKIASIMSILLNWAIKNEVEVFNPMRHLDKIPNPKRDITWEPEQVNKFIATAYSKWKWRSIGLIVQMAYEWGQRVGDMRMLMWTAIDFDKRRCDLVQSKRGAAVHLPIMSDELMFTLKQQHKAFGFQCLVTPQMKPKDGAWKPYSKETLYVHVNRVLDAAGLPMHLTAMDMRRSAITEMVEAGVPTPQIMTTTGHNSLNSLTPYIKNTFSGASGALAQRQAHKDAQDA